MTYSTIRTDTGRKELFLLIARALADEHARMPTDRYARLVHALAGDAWLDRLTGWMARYPALRTLRLAAVAEAAHARGSGTRRMIDQALHRADEPGELLMYWLVRYGRAIPQPVKRGVADAAVRLYDELALATYDSPGAAMRFADVLALTHPAPRGPVQAAVFRHAIARRRGLVDGIPESLPLLRARRALYWIPAERRPLLLERPGAAEVMAEAAMSWPTVRRWLLGTMTGPAWQAVLPSMSYLDRLAHLADFDRTGVPGEVAARVAEDLAEPAEVIRSGVTPFELHTALHSVPGSRWSPALHRAMDLSLANVPAPAGRTLVIVDRADAAVFGAALALRSPSVELCTAGRRVPVAPGESVTEVVARMSEPTGPAAEIRDGYERIIVLTEPGRAAEAAETITRPGHEHVITELGSGWFAAIPAIEQARSERWPF